MNVFLIGFMGSGKTSIGKLLAKSLKMPFIDMDNEIALYEKQPISEIFSSKGEEYFRNLETKWLTEYSGNGYLISVGGGTPCFNNNLELMKQKGLIVYLTLPIEMMAQRVSNAKTVRPIIQPYLNDYSVLLEFMNHLLNEREPFYKQADLIFEASNMSANKKKLLTDMVSKMLDKKIRLL